MLICYSSQVWMREKRLNDHHDQPTPENRTPNPPDRGKTGNFHEKKMNFVVSILGLALGNFL